PGGEELRPSGRVVAIEGRHVGRVGAQVDPRRALVERRVDLRAGDPVAGGAIGRLEPDLAGALELRRVRVARPLAVPEVEDARRVAPLLRGDAPVARRERAVLLPTPAGDLDLAVPVPADPEQADDRRLALAADRERVLPPVAFDAVEPADVGDRLLELHVHGPDVGRRG